MSLKNKKEEDRAKIVKALDQFLDSAYAQVQESEARLSAIVEASPTAKVMIDQSGVIHFINPTLVKFFGYSEDELLGEKVEILLPEAIKNDHPNLRDSFFKAPTMRAMGGSRNLLGRRKDGSTFPVEIGLNPVKQNGELYALATITDITERVNIIQDLESSNAQVQESEARLLAIMEASPTGMVMINQSGVIHFINPTLVKFFGYSEDELLGEKVEILLPEAIKNDHPNLRDSFFKAPTMRAMGGSRNLLGRRKDGSTFPVEIGLNPVKQKGELYALATISDITERVNIIQDLESSNTKVQESEARLLAIIEASPTGMVMIDEDGVIQFINPTLVRFFGYSEKELLGEKVEILLPQEIREKHPGQRDGFFKAPTMRSMGGNRNLLGRRKDGSTFPVEIGLNPVKQKGKLYALATITDISERENIIQDLKASNEKLEKSNEELETYAYRSSHDLRSPLASITSLCQLGKLNLADQEFDKIEGILDHIESSSKKMSNLVRDIIEISRANFKENEKEEIEVSELIEKVIENLNSYIEEYSVEIISEIKDEGKLVTEKERLYQIIENLVSNAIVYCDKKKDRSFVKIISKEEQKGVSIEISDNGIGIDEKQCEKIFNMFFRAHEDKEHSSGLGLYIVNRHIEKLEGEISCESKLGEGSKFTIYLPNTEVK